MWHEDVKKIIEKNPGTTFRITIQNANSTATYTGTIAALDIESFSEKLMLATDQGDIMIHYRQIIEIQEV